MSRKCFPFAMNPETFEVYARTPDREWSACLSAWVSCRQRRTSDSHRPAVPSPMPFGHIMFEVRKDNSMRLLSELPAPIWSDGVGCVYEGQPIHWQQHDRMWRSGVAVAADGDQILVRDRTHGGTVLLPAKTLQP